jgi:hypothetical protein
MEIENQEAILAEVANFTSTNAATLLLSVSTVKATDKLTVTASLTAYNGLSSAAKAKLTAEKALLDSLLTEIQRQEAVLGEVAAFRTDHATALGLVVSTVKITDLSAIEMAISAYAQLSPDAKSKLTSENSLLGSLLTEIHRQQALLAEITKFKTDHPYALALKITTVNISDLPYVQSALTAYNLLSESAKASLTADKALLDSLVVEITNQQAVLQTLTNYKTNVLAGVTSGNFTNLVIGEDTISARLLAVNNAALLIVNNANVSVTVTYISEGNYVLTLKYSGYQVEVTFPITATFVFNQILKDKIAVSEAQKKLTEYFLANPVLVKDYAENVKFNAFITKANYLISGQDITLTVKSSIHRPGNNPSIFEITLTKNGTTVTFVISVEYTVKGI